MSQLLIGSLCLTDIADAAKKGHSAFVKHNNGKVYVNIKVWINDTPDKYNNDASVVLNSTKEKKESEGTLYVGNMKKFEHKEPQPLSSSDISSVVNDLPF